MDADVIRAPSGSVLHRKLPRWRPQDSCEAVRPLWEMSLVDETNASNSSATNEIETAVLPQPVVAIDKLPCARPRHQ
eukprot:scaffold570_cov382-Prasinococcus_capsulatus_cf.AAC.19